MTVPRPSHTGDLYFSTDNFVWGVSDAASSLSNKFAAGISLGGGVTPSAALYVPGSGLVYVGGSDGWLYQIDVSGATPVLESEPLGDGSALVGAPSFDKDFDLVQWERPPASSTPSTCRSRREAYSTQSTEASRGGVYRVDRAASFASCARICAITLCLRLYAK